MIYYEYFLNYSFVSFEYHNSFTAHPWLLSPGMSVQTRIAELTAVVFDKPRNMRGNGQCSPAPNQPFRCRFVERKNEGNRSDMPALYQDSQRIWILHGLLTYYDISDIG